MLKMLTKAVVAALFTIPNAVYSQPVLSDKQCLASAVYYEARGEPLRGQKAVVEVIINRVKRRGLSICQVVLQSKQFSFVSDKTQWLSDKASSQVLKALDKAGRSVGKCATHYHNTSVNPKWADAYILLKRIGNHLFYGRPECVMLARNS